MNNPNIKNWNNYVVDRINMHHSWGDHNVEICELVKSPVNRKAIDDIMQKISSNQYNIEDVFDAGI